MARSASPGLVLLAHLQAQSVQQTQEKGLSAVNTRLTVPVFFDKHNSGKKNWGLICKVFSNLMPIKVMNSCMTL